MDTYAITLSEWIRIGLSVILFAYLIAGRLGAFRGWGERREEDVATLTLIEPLCGKVSQKSELDELDRQGRNPPSSSKRPSF